MTRTGVNGEIVAEGRALHQVLRGIKVRDATANDRKRDRLLRGPANFDGAGAIGNSATGEIAARIGAEAEFGDRHELRRDAVSALRGFAAQGEDHQSGFAVRAVRRRVSAAQDSAIPTISASGTETAFGAGEFACARNERAGAADSRRRRAARLLISGWRSYVPRSA